MKNVFKTEGNRFVIDGNEQVVIYKQMPEYDILNFYFEKDGKKYFFKANSKYSSDVGEILAYAVDNAANVNAAKFVPAVFKKDGKEYYGVLSEDILRNDKTVELLNGSHLLAFYQDEQTNEQGKKKERYNTLEHYRLSLNIIESEKLIVDKNFILDLAKHMISGFIRSDEDMHAHNIPVVVKNMGPNQKYISVGQLFDNSMSFLIKSHRNNIKEEFDLLNEKEKIEKVEKYLDDAGFPFQVKAESRRQTSRQFISKEIAQLLVKYPNLYQHYLSYKKLNIKKILTEFKQENGYDFIKDSDIELASMVVKSSINLIEQAFYYEKMKSSGPMRFLNQTKDELNLEF